MTTTTTTTDQLTGSQAAAIADQLAGNHRPTTASNRVIGWLADLAGCSQQLADDLTAAAANRQAAGHDASRLTDAAADWLLTADQAAALVTDLADADLLPTDQPTDWLAVSMATAITMAELAAIRARGSWLTSMDPSQAAELTELTDNIRSAATDRLTCLAAGDIYRPFQQPANADGSRPAVARGC